ncbi:uncharacterized protein PGTG_16564 [Puccinia graminis f. sp. tritici CRL 75-36-700-3]|uniref:Uncharacterized protein n=1 Tax=Puccinia graminis f. sp. tritici (strain CRL 75-36-700-3 / race SCCL) TaxID=418459 RepID=E3L1W3_PUCGT|nr:uncharacterized protein PGTG_16564 [Puccinia graminis f. sp. tritici CRL 75-36-700-3]EFP90538.1 hypothetical protein PGTG_16564 [Puccinia graminis f. sp. tritici CRL 75-36-700-3]
MHPWLKTKAAILLTSCIAFTKQLDCPRRRCNGVSNSTGSNYTEPPQCHPCTQLVPLEYHECTLCGHQWTAPMLNRCPKANTNHANQQCARPNTSAAA